METDIRLEAENEPAERGRERDNRQCPGADLLELLEEIFSLPGPAEELPERPGREFGDLTELAEKSRGERGGPRLGHRQASASA
jgi:hypothetical protein